MLRPFDVAALISNVNQVHSVHDNANLKLEPKADAKIA